MQGTIETGLNVPQMPEFEPTPPTLTDRQVAAAEALSGLVEPFGTELAVEAPVADQSNTSYTTGPKGDGYYDDYGDKNE